MIDIEKKEEALNWLYLDLNSYFASVEQHLNPKLRGKPVIVVPVMSDYTSVIAASYEAKAFGIKTGTRIGDAKILCPEVIAVTGNHEVYVDYHHKIMQEIDKYVQIEKVCSIDEVACRLTGSWQREEIIVQIAKNVKQALKDNIGECITCSIGIAENRFLAKVASNLQKPDGLVVLYNKQVPERLNHLQPKDLPGIGRNMDRRLKVAGIYSMQKLYELSSKNMRRIWGNIGGEVFWYMLHGYQVEDDPIKKRVLGHSHVIAPEFRPIDEARKVAIRLILKAASRLRRLEYYTCSLYLSCTTIEGAKLKSHSEFHKLNDNASLLQELANLWQAMLDKFNPAFIKKISISFNNLVQDDNSQLSLSFDEADEELEYLENKNQAFNVEKDYKTKNTPIVNSFINKNINKTKSQKLSKVMDALNTKYGRNTIVMGGVPEKMNNFSGQKIAFTRIPDKDEFKE